MSKHTPGLWRVSTRNFNGKEYSAYITHDHPTRPWRSDVVGGWGITAQSSGETIEEAEANARLIAAAPELLEACKNVVAWFESIAAMQHALLVRDQSLESAAENWDKATLDIPPLDIEPIKAAIAKAEIAPTQVG